MKTVVLLALAALSTAACSTDKSTGTVKAEHTDATSMFFDASWQIVGTANSTGGSFGGLISNSYPFALTLVDQVAVKFPASCGLTASAMQVVAPNQFLIATRFSDADNVLGTSIMYFAVNGNGSALLSGVTTTTQLAPGAVCNGIETYVHPVIAQAL